MSDRRTVRCPACDAVIDAGATFCARCGRPLGSDAVLAPPRVDTGTIDRHPTNGARGSMIAAIVVAAVLIVGGAVFLLAEPGDGDDTLGPATSDSVVPGIAPGVAPDVSTGTTPVAESTTTDSTAPTTVQVTDTVIVTAPPVTPPAVTAPAVIVAPVTASPVPAVSPTPAPAPVPTPAPAPSPAGSLTFERADVFFRDYIATAMSGDHAAAWNMLSTSDRADYPRGFDQFVAFWRSVSFADVQRVESVGGSAGFQSLTVEMAYGQVDGDPTSFEVIEVDVNVRPDGSLQIFDYRYVRSR